jgi:DNA-binding beta-propeller fold protein YncE
VNLGIVDTEHDALLGVLPVVLSRELYRFVAVDERDGKVYIASQCGDYERGDTMWVVDCATDSVLKRFKCVPRGKTNQCIRWVPWSNRLYLVNIYPDASHNSSLVVIDCNTDSVIVPGMLLGDGFIYDIQLDPIHQRIFVTGGDPNAVYVLRDTGYAGITGTTPTGQRPAPGLRLQMSSGGCEVSYSVASPGRVALSVYDLMGREVRQLVAEEQSIGEHSAVWNGTDRNGAAVARGVYFVRLETPGFSDVKKAVVTR